MKFGLPAALWLVMGSWLLQHTIAQPTPIMQMTNKSGIDNGWKDTLNLTNGFLELQVVPSIGKIMGFSAPGLPDVIWSNPKTRGMTLQQASALEPIFGWANFGGDRFWVVQQSDNLQVRNGRSWPADETFDGKPWTCTLSGDGILSMQSETSPESGVRAWRRFDMKHGSELMIMRQKIKAMPGHTMRPLCMIQNVCSVRPPDKVIFQISPRTHFIYPTNLKNQLPRGIGTQSFPKPPVLSKFASVEGEYVILTLPDENFTGKIYADCSSGWICALYGQMAFFQLFKYVQGEYYPDGGCSVEVYVSHYFELELLSPARTLRIGEELNFDTGWGVVKLNLNGNDPVKLAKQCQEKAEMLLARCQF